MKGARISQDRRRYDIVPQMRDYDALEEKVWLPYIMNFHPPRWNTPTFTTDEYGFRGTFFRQKRLSWQAYNDSEYPRAALIGASTAFGVGASSDAFTLASLLNNRQDRIWFNFSGRAFNSTQELLIFLLHLPRSVETVLIFSGVNNLVLSHLAQAVSPIYNSFYGQRIFERGLNKGKAMGVRGTLRLLVEEITTKLIRDRNGNKPAGPEGNLEDLIRCFQRDMRLWSLLREAMNFKLYFVFQPIASWIEKALTPEEEEIFSILNRSNSNPSWREIEPYLRDQQGDYVFRVKQVCHELAIPFLDLNTQPAFAQNRWLFVDRAHLTDEGYALSVKEIVRGDLQ